MTNIFAKKVQLNNKVKQEERSLIFYLFMAILLIVFSSVLWTMYALGISSMLISAIVSTEVLVVLAFFVRDTFREYLEAVIQAKLYPQ